MSLSVLLVVSVASAVALTLTDGLAGMVQVSARGVSF